jgi:hypothetical protein
LGSPFRGLDAYEFQHAPIFYGRNAAARQAIEQLAAYAADGTAFLLVLGASGSGKSPLVRAGLLPELSVPRAVSGVGVWRRVIFRPSTSPYDLFEGLARHIARPEREHPGIGLPEIVSDYFPVEVFARHLRDNPSSPGAPFQLALGQIAAALARSEVLLRGEQVRLVLVVDQLEELFTDPAMRPAEHERFVVLLAGSGTQRRCLGGRDDAQRFLAPRGRDAAIGRAGERSRPAVDVAIETSWGDNLGAVIEAGSTLPLGGEPRPVGGVGRARFRLRADCRDHPILPGRPRDKCVVIACLVPALPA